jgi:hypothetical protein
MDTTTVIAGILVLIFLSMFITISIDTDSFKSDESDAEECETFIANRQKILNSLKR